MMLSADLISIQWISVKKNPYWIVIYPANSVVDALNAKVDTCKILDNLQLTACYEATCDGVAPSHGK